MAELCWATGAALRMGLLSPELHVDSSMVKANVNSYGLSRSGMTVEEFQQQAIEENGLFVITHGSADKGGVEHEEVRYFQDAKGRQPQMPVGSLLPRVGLHTPGLLDS